MGRPRHLLLRSQSTRLTGHRPTPRRCRAHSPLRREPCPPTDDPDTRPALHAPQRSMLPHRSDRNRGSDMKRWVGMVIAALMLLTGCASRAETAASSSSNAVAVAAEASAAQSQIDAAIGITKWPPTGLKE